MNQRETKIHVELCKFVRLAYPRALFHSDTGSGVKLTIAQAKLFAKLRKKRGHPDFMIYDASIIPNPSTLELMVYNGLALELKAEGVKLFKKDGEMVLNPHFIEQAEYLKDLERRGWSAKFAVGLDMAMKEVDRYMKGVTT